MSQSCPKAAVPWAGDLQEPEPHSVGLLEHVDEIAGDVGLARRVRLEVAQDAVLALAPEGCLEQLREGRQTVWVVREPELTATGPPAKREGCWPSPPHRHLTAAKPCHTCSQESHLCQSLAPALCSPGLPCGPCCSLPALMS